jgi:hypothetical protein
VSDTKENAWIENALRILGLQRRNMWTSIAVRGEATTQTVAKSLLSEYRRS